MTLQQKLEQIGTALVAAVGDDVFHYWRPGMNPPFCVWAEDGEQTSHYSSNRKQEQTVTGIVDYYTKTEYDTTLDDIQTALYGLSESMPFVWALDSVQFEEDTNTIHYQWRWSVA